MHLKSLKLFYYCKIKQQYLAVKYFKKGTSLNTFQEKAILLFVFVLTLKMWNPKKVISFWKVEKDINSWWFTKKFKIKLFCKQNKKVFIPCTREKIKNISPKNRFLFIRNFQTLFSYHVWALRWEYKVWKWMFNSNPFTSLLFYSSSRYRWLSGRKLQIDLKFQSDYFQERKCHLKFHKNKALGNLTYCNINKNH